MPTLPVPPLRPFTRLEAQALLPTRWGALRAAATAEGLAGLWFVEGQKDTPAPLAVPTDPDHPHLRAAAAALAAFEAGDAQATDAAVLALPMTAAGTDFQRAVWQQLLAIPFGRDDHYGAIAARLGRPQAMRAVGAAVGRNPISLLIPCHRVLGRDRALTGYAGGLARKVALLAHEGIAFKEAGLCSADPSPSKLPSKLAASSPAPSSAPTAKDLLDETP